MKPAHGKMSLIFGCVMGVLTILISLVVADGIFWIESTTCKSHKRTGWVSFLLVWYDSSATTVP